MKTKLTRKLGRGRMRGIQFAQAMNKQRSVRLISHL